MVAASAMSSGSNTPSVRWMNPPKAQVAEPETPATM
jgi:hypothetical protein